jgi:gamma-glutamyltranspeptidase/glutathione hydrolase
MVTAIASPPLAPGATLNVRPGLMTLADLSGYEARIRQAARTTYRGYTLHGAGLPSSGGLTIEMGMNLLEGFDPAPLDQAAWLHRMLESMRLSFADRNAFMADPEFASVPVEGLLSKEYADVRRALIDPAAAASAPAVPGDPAAYQVDPSVKSGGDGILREPFLDLETTHITVVDASGSAVSYTCTIESEGGNGVVVPGYGFLLNNELTDFNIPTDPAGSHPNVLESGKRPRSSIAPVLVLKDDKLVLALGSPGGSTIITTVAQILTQRLDRQMTIEEALAAPRVSQRNAGNLSSAAEPEFLASPEAAELQAMGHVLVELGPIGAATAIEVGMDGTLTVAAEPVRRNGGSAMVVDPR